MKNMKFSYITFLETETGGQGHEREGGAGNKMRD